MSTTDNRIFDEENFVNDLSTDTENAVINKKKTTSTGAKKRKKSKRRRRRRRILAILAFTLGLLLVYAGFSIYFVNHFYPNTVVNAENAGWSTADSVKKMIEDQGADYFLKLETVTGSFETISPKDVNLEYTVSKAELEALIKNQNPLLWPAAFFTKSEYDIQKDTKLNEASLEAKIDSLNCVTRTPEKVTKNAHVALAGSKYEIVKEVYGEDIDKATLIEKVREALIEHQTDLNLWEAEVYTKPTVLSTDTALVNSCNALNNILKSDITYTFGSRTEHLGSDTLVKWVSQDADGNPVIDDKAVTDYIAELAKKYDTAGKPKTIIRTMTGQPATVSAGTYGWKIDQEAEKKKLLEDLGKGTTVKRNPEYSQKAASRDGNDYGGTYIEVDISFQTIVGYVNGNKIFSGPMVSGSVLGNSQTVLGAYAIYSKQTNRWLNGPTWHDWVFYWMPFYRDYGIHDATWREEFGGDIYYANGSHGCVNLPQEIAAAVYNNFAVGTPVLVFK